MQDFPLTAFFFYCISLDLTSTLIFMSIYSTIKTSLISKTIDAAFISILQVSCYYILVLDTRSFFGEVAAYGLTMIIMMSHTERRILSVNHVKSTLEAIRFATQSFILLFLFYVTKLKLKIVVAPS